MARPHAAGGDVYIRVGSTATEQSRRRPEFVPSSSSRLYRRVYCERGFRLAQVPCATRGVLRFIAAPSCPGEWKYDVCVPRRRILLTAGLTLALAATGL